MVRWFKENGATLLFIVAVAAIGGVAGALAPTLWFVHGVCG